MSCQSAPALMCAEHYSAKSSTAGWTLTVKGEREQQNQPVFFFSESTSQTLPEQQLVYLVPGPPK
ncbi:unnamed protein product [Staurois parvus]|uniref:Uncharacterized protein n=1 Tax=Staurois parvus TaxID=386267 RepID=A0ABN9HCU8_9NEOB|nr:unnamed protein product [Staurois parvus]